MSAAADVVALAINLARHNGYAVFPCAEDKRPTLKGWPERASTDPNEIARLWWDHGGPLIGIATGQRSGVDVLDFDVKHNEALWWWRTHRPRLPATAAYRTRSGGLHLYFRHTEGVRNTASRVIKGIDTRGDGGFVISWFAAGLACLDPSAPAPWPDWLLALVLPPPPKPVMRQPFKPKAGDADFAILSICRRVARANEGERNAVLNWAAFRLGARVAAGEMGRSEAEALLQGAAAAAGLPAPEATTTIASGLRGAGA
jgi:Bifunctional DNA primase/polymerase, N-terminal